MKAKLLGVATALALLGASPAVAITYLISDNAGIPSDPQGGLFLTGSITTNGTIGTLSSVNIAAWNLNISGHGQLVLLSQKVAGNARSDSGKREDSDISS